MNTRAGSRRGSPGLAWLAVLGLGLAGVLSCAGLAWYLVNRGAMLRAPRMLPGGYTVARYTGEGSRGGWGLTPPGDPFGRVELVRPDGGVDHDSWILMRLAVAGNRLVGIGDRNDARRVVAFELDTSTGKLTMLEGIEHAERRVTELQGTDPSAGWVDMYELPLAPRPKP